MMQKSASKKERMATHDQAQWICYPGDFEMMPGLWMWSARTERGTRIMPDWRVETFCPDVKFRKRFTLTEDTL